MYPLMNGRAAAATARLRPIVLIAAFAAATFVLVAGSLPTPLRVLVGSLLVFALPGWALGHAVYPRRRLSLQDRIVAAGGLSLVISTCSAVLLAATPIGLSGESLALLLGGVTVLLWIVGELRGGGGER